MTSCVRCGHELGIGRFCLNCGHPVGEPAPAQDAVTATAGGAPPGERSDRGGPAWVPWAVGVGILLVLLGALAVLATWFGGGGEAASRPADTARASAESEAPAPLAEVAVTFMLPGASRPAIKLVTTTDDVLIAGTPAA